MARALDGQALRAIVVDSNSELITQAMIVLVRGSPPGRNPHGNKGNIRVISARSCLALSKLKALGRSFHGFWRPSMTPLSKFDQPPLSCGVDGGLLKEFLDPA
jgi:hypothetical protein